MLSAPAMLVSRSRVGVGSLAWLLAVQACGSETEGADARDGGGDEPVTPEADSAPSGTRDASSPRDAAPEASVADATSPTDASNADAGDDASAPTDGVKCASWNVETIFPVAGHVTTGAGDSTSLAFDAAGAAHVAFSTNLGLYYGTNASGAWAFELVPSPRPVSGTTIALGAQGRVDIV